MKCTPHVSNYGPRIRLSVFVFPPSDGLIEGIRSLMSNDKERVFHSSSFLFILLSCRLGHLLTTPKEAENGQKVKASEKFTPGLKKERCELL